MLGEGGDIADFCKAHNSDALQKLADLPMIEPAAPRPKFDRNETAEPNTDSNVDWPAENDLWWQKVVLPMLEQYVGQIGSKHFTCIFPELHKHSDKTPSARISTTKDPNGIYVCQCGPNGAYSREAVAERLGAPDFMTWWKDNRQPLFNKTRQAKKAKRPPLADQIGPFDLPAYTASQTVDAEFITDALTPANLRLYKTIALKSGTGTGKTSLAGRGPARSTP
jgi:hypothetical protein